jgi:hypothetical protein
VIVVVAVAVAVVVAYSIPNTVYRIPHTITMIVLSAIFLSDQVLGALDTS